MAVRKTVWRDPVYGNDRRRAQQYWAKRSELLGAGYMLPTASELEEWNTRMIRAGKAQGINLSADAGRLRSEDKDAPDLLVWGEDALIAAEIFRVETEIDIERAKKTIPPDPQQLTALSHECRSNEFLDSHSRKPGSEGS